MHVCVYLLSSIHRRAGRAFRLITSWVWASSPVTMLPTVRRAGREKREKGEERVVSGVGESGEGEEW